METLILKIKRNLISRKMSALVVCFFVFTFPGIVDAGSFYRNLKIGDFGEDVKNLQILLNNNSITKIAESGPGSPGQETSYFGLLTYGAVTKFQELYKRDVLDPAGLSYGTGYVGLFTRSKLNELANNPNLSLNAPNQYGSDSDKFQNQNIVSAENSNTRKGHPNNYEHLDEHISKIKELGRSNGQGEKELALIEEEIRKMAESPKDLKEEFYEKAAGSMRQTSGWKNFFSNLMNPLIPMAYAQGLSLPFGGQIQNIIECTCSASVSNVYIGQPSPVTADYQYGTQMYLNYNFPTSIWALGLYTPGVVGTCEIYVGSSCSPVYSQGLVTGTVGTGATVVPVSGLPF